MQVPWNCMRGPSILHASRAHAALPDPFTGPTFSNFAPSARTQFIPWSCMRRFLGIACAGPAYCMHHGSTLPCLIHSEANVFQSCNPCSYSIHSLELHAQVPWSCMRRPCILYASRTHAALPDPFRGPTFSNFAAHARTQLIPWSCMRRFLGIACIGPEYCMHHRPTLPCLIHAKAPRFPILHPVLVLNSFIGVACAGSLELHTQALHIACITDPRCLA